MDTATQWDQPDHPRRKAAKYLIFGLNAAGIASAVAMVAILVIR